MQLGGDSDFFSFGGTAVDSVGGVIIVYLGMDVDQKKWKGE
jgi:hypothetical protein